MNLGSAAGSTAPEIDVDAIEVIPIPSAIRAVPQSEPPLSPQTWSGTYNATPHLTVDKHMSMKLPNWRTPSFDETEGLLSRNNRQILLFCIGFVFPLGIYAGNRDSQATLMQHSLVHGRVPSFARSTTMEGENSTRTRA